MPISVGEGCVAADHDGKRDYWRCFCADGQPQWVHEYPNDREMDYGAGPRAAPLIHNGKVFCLNAWGELYCLRMADGSLAWQKHLAKEFAQKTPEWGYTASPLMAHGKLLVTPGGKGGPVAALDPETGAVLWTGAGHGLNYANLTLATLGGVEQVVGYDDRTAGAWDRPVAALGKPPGGKRPGYIVPSPVAVHGKLLLTSDQEGSAAALLQPGRVIAEEPAAINEDIAPRRADPYRLGETVPACQLRARARRRRQPIQASAQDPGSTTTRSASRVSATRLSRTTASLSCARRPGSALGRQSPVVPDLLIAASLRRT